MTSAITIFEESGFVSYGLVTKSLGAAGCTFEEVAKKIKCQKKDECESFYNQIQMNHLTWFFKGQNPFKLLYSIMILNTISLHADKPSTYLLVTSIFQLLFPLIVMLGKSLATWCYTPDCRLHAQIITITKCGCSSLVLLH
jgi:hypothetical protein